jgi:AcrR family transcriptional regulator
MTVGADKPAGPRSSKGRRTRARLLGAAKESFEEYGFADARISDIAERAGLSYGVFYHYFPSKEEIFREVAAFHERRVGAAVVAETDLVPATAENATLAKLEAANRRYLAEYRREAALMRVIEQVSRYDGALGEARLYRHKLYAERLAEAIVHLQQQGIADPAIDPTVGSQAIMAMVTRFAEAWFVDGVVTCNFDEGVEQLNRLCRNAIVPARGSASSVASLRS